MWTVSPQPALSRLPSSDSAVLFRQLAHLLTVHHLRLTPQQFEDGAYKQRLFAAAVNAALARVRASSASDGVCMHSLQAPSASVDAIVRLGNALAIDKQFVYETTLTAQLNAQATSALPSLLLLRYVRHHRSRRVIHEMNLWLGNTAPWTKSHGTATHAHNLPCASLRIFGGAS